MSCHYTKSSIPFVWKYPVFVCFTLKCHFFLSPYVLISSTNECLYHDYQHLGWHRCFIPFLFAISIIFFLRAITNLTEIISKESNSTSFFRVYWCVNYSLPVIIFDCFPGNLETKIAWHFFIDSRGKTSIESCVRI